MKQVLVEWKTDRSAEEQLVPISEEWDKRIYREALIHIYCGIPDEKAALNVAGCIYRYCPYAKTIGTMSAGEIMDGHEMSQGILISALFFEDTRIHVFRFDHVSGRESAVGRQLCTFLNDIADIKAAELIFPGLEMDTRDFFDELKNMRSDIQIFGAYSGGHMMNAPMHFVFDRNDILADSIFIAVYAGENFHIDIDKTIGWDSLGNPFRVTKAIGNQLIELDGRPASEIYERFLHIDRTQDDSALAGYEFPLMARYMGDEWLRSAVHIDENGVLNLHGYMVEGMDIYLSYGNPSRIVDLENKRLEAIRQFRPQAILLYSCIVRKQFWGDLIDMELSPFGELASTAGFHTWGEILRSAQTGIIFEHNVTLLSIAMREGDLEEHKLADPAIVDDSNLRGQASLLQRLASLINITMRELRIAHSDLQLLNQKLVTVAEHDGLTGLYDRRKIEQLIHEEFDDSEITGKDLSMIMIDIDHFKNVNDSYGHHAGDMVLREVANILKHTAFEHLGAAAGRWGGEEFFLVLPDLASDGCLRVAEELRKKVEKHDFSSVGNMTVSIGLLTINGKIDRKAAFTKVDDALYQAKESGRNRCVQAFI